MSNFEPKVQNLGIDGFIKDMEPAEFVRTGSTFLKQTSEAFHVYREKSTDEERIENRTTERILLGMADLALNRVQLDVEGQDLDADIVRMVQASGTAPDRLWNLWKAERVATNLHKIREQLAKNPHSPILSVFVNEYHVDMHHGVTVQAAYAAGDVSWRTDPFRDNGGGDPEVVIGVHDWLAPAMTRSREQAIRDVEYAGASSSILDRSDNEFTIVGDDWCTLLTDDCDPQYLIRPENGEEGESYDEWLDDELGFEARMKSGTHLIAIGDEAVARLIERFERELAPHLKSTKAGTIESRRILAHMQSALASLEGQGQAVSIDPDNNIRYDVQRTLSETLTDLLASNRIYKEKYEYFPSHLLRKCDAAQIPIDQDYLVEQVFEGIADNHVSDLVSPEELRAAIEDEVAGTLSFY